MSNVVDVIDLYKLVKDFGSLSEVKVYGRIINVMPAPKCLISNIEVDENCVCVCVELLAINLSNYVQKLSQMGIRNSSNIYFVNARMSAYVSKDVLLNDWYTLEGTLRLASRTLSPVLAMYEFYKTTSNTWGVHSTSVCNVECSEFDSSSRVYKYLIESDATGKLVLPDDVLCMKQCLEDEPDRTIPLVPVGDGTLGGFETQWEKMIPASVREELKVPSIKEISYDLKTIKPVSKVANALSKACAMASTQCKSTARNLKTAYSLGNTREKVEYVLDKLFKYSSRKPFRAADTGQMIIKEYLSRLGVNVKSEYMGVPFYQFIAGMLDEIKEYMLDKAELLVTAKAKRVIEEYFSDEEFFFAGVLSVITGINIYKLTAVAEYCSSNDISFIKIAYSNPYLFLTMPIRLEFNDVELLSLVLGNSHNDVIKKHRDMAILYDHMTNFDSSTCFLERELYTNKLGLTLTKAKYSRHQTNGTFLSDYVCSNILAYIDVGGFQVHFGYPPQKWVAIKNSTYYISYLGTSEVTAALELGISLGLFVRLEIEGNKWVSTRYLAEAEVNIYAKLHELFHYEHDVVFEAERVDELINQFEEVKGFKLEPEQRKAVHLIKHNVFCITGCAGSGKTTVSDCIAYVVENYKTDAEYDFKLRLAAPTGKAANRMKEVLHRPASTMHTMFRLNSDPKYVTLDEADMYLLDEQSMVNLFMMNSTLSAIENSRVCFLGDIEQLNPIGKGLPFKNIMRFVPTVKLGVSKRSAASSTITRNSDRIINNSSENNWADLDLGEDFSIIPCAEKNIATITNLLCRHNLGIMTEEDKQELSNILGYSADKVLLSTDGVTPADIQVVSPLEKPTYSWGCYSMNKVLHSTFNPNTRDSFVWRFTTSTQGTEFRIGDRVINTVTDYDAQHYTSFNKSNEFIKAWGAGVINGDIGKVVTVIKASECKFLEPTTEKPKDYEERSSVRDDSKFVGDDNYFVVVEFTDFLSGDSYYSLFTATLNQELSTYEQRVFSYGSLARLQLFYAGTTHKLQGSQSKVIIALLSNMYYSDFITRNMIYTQITRASDKVYLVGDVNVGRNTAIGKARLNVADSSVRTWGELT